MYWALATLDILLRVAAFHRTKRPVFAWFLAFTIPGEAIAFWLGWNHHLGSFAYDYFWRGYELVALLGVAAVTWEAVSVPASHRAGVSTLAPIIKAIRPTTVSRHRVRTASTCSLPLIAGLRLTYPRYGTPWGPGRNLIIPAILTVAALFLLHHQTRWPGYYLEAVMRAIFGVNLFCGLVIVTRRRWTDHNSILAGWLLLTACLYSGAALEPRQVGLAGELLNCFAFAAWSIPSKSETAR